MARRRRARCAARLSCGLGALPSRRSHERVAEAARSSVGAGLSGGSRHRSRAGRSRGVVFCSRRRCSVCCARPHQASTPRRQANHRAPPSSTLPRSQRRCTRTIAAGPMRARRVMACGSDVGARAWRSSSASTHSAPRAAARIRPGACHLHADRIDPRPIPPHARAPCRTELARSARTPRSRRCWRGAVRECAWCVVELSGWATRRRRTEGRAHGFRGHQLTNGGRAQAGRA